MRSCVFSFLCCLVRVIVISFFLIYIYIYIVVYVVIYVCIVCSVSIYLFISFSMYLCIGIFSLYICMYVCIDFSNYGLLSSFIYMFNCLRIPLLCCFVIVLSFLIDVCIALFSYVLCIYVCCVIYFFMHVWIDSCFLFIKKSM